MTLIKTCNLKYDRVDSEFLDCLSDNLAVLLDHQDIADIRTPFAYQWYFDFDSARDAGMPKLERVSITESIYQQTGCVTRHAQFEPGQYLEACLPHLRDNRPVLIFGDSYFMPWLPYFGRQHMEHSFIVDGISDDQKLLHLVDAYQIRTEWGNAAPTDTYLPTMALARIIEELDTAYARSYLILESERQAEEVDLAALLKQNASQIADLVGDKEMVLQFSRHFRARMTDAAAMKDFSLACWLVARARKLHGLWLSDTAKGHPDLLNPAFVEQYELNVSAPWQKVAEFSYLLSRRVSQGRTAPDTCFQMLEETIHPNEIQTAKALARIIHGNRAE